MSALGTDHILYRRRFGSAYAKRSVQENPCLLQIVHILSTRLMAHLIESAETRTPTDVFHLNVAYGVDFVNAFTFGLSNGTNFLQDSEVRDFWLELYIKSRPKRYMYWLQEMAGIRAAFEQIGFKMVPDWVKHARQEFDHTTLDLVDRSEEEFSSKWGDSMSHNDYPTVYRQLRLNPIDSTSSKSSSPPPRLENYHRKQIASESLDHLGKLRSHHLRTTS